MRIYSKYIFALCFFSLTFISRAQNEIVLTDIEVLNVEKAFTTVGTPSRYSTPPTKFIGYRYKLLLIIKLNPKDYYFGNELLVTTKFPSGKIEEWVINGGKHLLTGKGYNHFKINITTNEIGWVNLSLSEWSSFLDREVESDDIEFIGNSIYLD